MKRLTVAAVLITTLALPATGADCATLTIEDRTITARTSVEGIQADLVGGYVNLVLGEWNGPEGWEGYAGETSVAIPTDTTTATVCPDGTVTFTTPAPPVESETEIGTAITIVKAPTPAVTHGLIFSVPA